MTSSKGVLPLSTKLGVLLVKMLQSTHIHTIELRDNHFGIAKLQIYSTNVYIYAQRYHSVDTTSLMYYAIFKEKNYFKPTLTNSLPLSDLKTLIPTPN